MVDARVTLRKHSPYHTRSNKIKIIRTPGANHRVLYHKKTVRVPHCADTGAPLRGLPRVHSIRLAKISKNRRHVSRAYGGKLTHDAVRQRILSRFLVAEARIMNRQKLEQEAKLKAQAEGNN